MAADEGVVAADCARTAFLQSCVQGPCARPSYHCLIFYGYLRKRQPVSVTPQCMKTKAVRRVEATELLFGPVHRQAHHELARAVWCTNALESFKEKLQRIIPRERNVEQSACCPPMRMAEPCSPPRSVLSAQRLGFVPMVRCHLLPIPAQMSSTGGPPKRDPLPGNFTTEGCCCS